MGIKITHKGCPSCRLPLPVIGEQRGSVLIALIITMVIIAGLGAALVTMSTTSSLSQFGAMDSFRAYYLAEAGGRYAIPIIKKNINDPATLIAQLNGKTFTLANHDSFQLTLSYAAATYTYTLVAKGILAQGAQALNATRAVTYSITGPGPGSTDIPFNTKTDLSNNWTGYNPAKVKVVKNKQADKAPALKLVGAQTALQLDWNNNPGLPNLVDTWEADDQLLSYALQVKTKIYNPTAQEYMIGLSFRNRSDSRYGLSFLKRNKCKFLPSKAFCTQIPGNDTNPYIVLWKNIAGIYTVLGYHKALAADNIVTSGSLNAWSTLVVKLEEQYVLDAFGQKVDVNGDGSYDRKNLITAYVQGTSLYPRDTIAWDYTKFQTFTWDAGPSSPVEDTSLTSENFDTLRPTEIGLHAFYPYAKQDNKQFIDDFSLKLGSGGSGSTTVIQY